MNKPEHLIYTGINSYWNTVDAMPIPPEWRHDFISLHKNSDDRFSLIMPTCVKSEKPGAAFFYESVKWDSLGDLTSFALRIMNRYPAITHIVDCTVVK
jgi:hypothetical protein